jgi:hypothetical protein
VAFRRGISFSSHADKIDAKGGSIRRHFFHASWMCHCPAGSAGG